MSFYVYKYVENNEIIYIGQTTRLMQRINEHKNESDKLHNFNGDIYYFECKTKKEMDSLEFLLINSYHPKYNISLKDNSLQYSLKELDWILYDENDFNLFKDIKNKFGERLLTAQEYDNLPFTLAYKKDVKQALKDKGYNTYAIRQTNVLGQNFLLKLNHGEMQFSPITLKRLCLILECQPGDLLEVIPINK